MSLTYPMKVPCCASFVLLGTLALMAAGCGRSGSEHPVWPQGVYPKLVTKAEAQARAPLFFHPALDDRSIAWELNETMRTLGYLRATMQSSDYSHQTTIDAARGVYRFDCSGMVDWVLRRSAPVAAGTVRRARSERPLAKDFYQAIAGAPTVGEDGGWARLPSVFDARPGDIVAWLPYEAQDSSNSGHVAFLVHRPAPIPAYTDAYLLRIADSTNDHHADDTRPKPNGSGFGLGTVVLVVDDRDSPIGYAWSATLSQRVRMTNIVIGRAVR